MTHFELPDTVISDHLTLASLISPVGGAEWALVCWVSG